jgi:DNA polymerase elongation subunit (family B)
MEPLINEGYEQLATYVNAFEQKMVMDREVISDNSVFCAKKRYAMSVWNSEGVAFTEPYIKMMGLEVVKSSTPAFVQGAMKKTITMMLNHTEVECQDFIKVFKREFKKQDPEVVARIAGVNNTESKYCNANGEFLTGVTVPMNSRAAIVYNKSIKDNRLDYEQIIPGDKIKYVHLTMPNKLQQKVIGFVSIMPPELDLHKKVDYDMLFEKTYLSPMKKIIDLIGWEMEPSASFEGVLF